MKKYRNSYNEVKKYMKIFIFTIVFLVLAGCFKEFEREVKDVKSNFIGLKRKVSVVGNDGSIIKTYEGRIDLEVNEYGNKVKFEVNGKRIMIFNLGVIVEEE